MEALQTILVAPLNWGLGHATRCIPLINELKHLGFEVVIGSDGQALHLLKNEFPGSTFIELPSYGSNYKSNHFGINIIRQIPALVNAIRMEQKLLSGLISHYGLCGIISDNRFGLYSKEVPTAILTHQVNIPVGVPGLHSFANRINHFYLQKFNEIWVPDFEGDFNLSGSMAHGTKLDKHLKYIGPVSRMTKRDEPFRYELLVVLSGTEPQRTTLEHIILRQLANLPYKTLLVQGITNKRERFKCSSKLEIVSFMTGDELNEAIMQAGLVISRSGYTTIMDLAVLGKKALLVATPGQKEQERLAEHFNNSKIFYSVPQKSINLFNDIPAAMNFSGFSVDISNGNLMRSVITQWLERYALLKTPQSFKSHSMAR